MSTDSLDSTNVSLLERLKSPVDQKAWSRFVDLYTPLIYCWARQIGARESDAADLVQEVFGLLVQKMPEFAYDPHKKFRAWLRTVTLNKWRDRCRREAARPNEVHSDDSLNRAEAVGDDWLGETEYRQQLVARAMQLMQSEFQPTTWKACWEFVVVGRSAAEISRELGISENAVHLAKGRVLRRLRKELHGLFDD